MKIKWMVVFLFLFSCSRDNSSLNTQGEPEISFDLDGSHYAFIGEQSTSNGGKGVFAIKMKGVPGGIATYYSLAGNSGPSNQIQLIIISDSLKTMSYRLEQGTGSGIIINQSGYSLLDSADYLDVSVSSYSGSIVNGSFSGKLTHVLSLSPLTTQSATVTNGKIKNVTINY